MLKILISLLLLSLSLGANAQGKKWAVLVGVAKYDNADVGDLKYTVKDVQGLKTALIKEAGFDEEQVIVLTNESRGGDRATDTNVLRRLEFVASKIGPSDTFVFYFSGHGFSNNGKHFLATANTDITDLRSLERSSIAVDELKAQLGRIRAKQCVFIFDACRNSPTGKGTSDQQLTAGLARDLKLTASSAQVPVVFLMSCKEGQKSFEYEDKQHGAFTWFLLEGMRGRAVEDGGLLTMNGLGKYVQSRMKDWSAQYLNGQSQTPDFLQFGGAATVVLARKSTSKLAVGGQVQILNTEALVSITTEPKGAKILLNGTDTGRKSPANIEVGMMQPQETAILELELSGYKLARLKLELQQGVETPVNQKLVKAAQTGPTFPLPPVEKPKIITKINPKDGAEMIYIPAGEFLMGDTDQGNNPRRKVITKGYWIYKYPVTVAQYRKFCEATGAPFGDAPEWGWRDDNPYVNVNWFMAQKYGEWAGVRLPTEAEWEKAARGTDGRQFPWGNEFDPSKLFSSRDKFGDALSPAPVFRTLRVSPSPYGVVDMVGNVWQWCQDEQSAGTNTRVRRGGSWVDSDPAIFRCSFRAITNPGSGPNYFGFRCAMSE